VDVSLMISAMSSSFLIFASNDVLSSISMNYYLVLIYPDSIKTSIFCHILYIISPCSAIGRATGHNRYLHV